ncbi:MAG TPA: cytochrome c oxidase accessory protein CcoG [Thermoanaerobaculia bacterium]|nr:cytochrome c oxidase accessory protein CcoG [Thermoanaerobaculia bacterium]
MTAPAAAKEERERAAKPAGRERVFEVAPEEELLYSMSADGKRKFIRPVLHRGRYWKVRRAMAWGLFVLFVALPLVPLGGHPAVHLDLGQRLFHVLGTTFHPTDNVLLLLFGFGVIVTVFFVGSTFGRMWCGYACPQTVYLEFFFRPVELFLEGTPPAQRKLNAAPMSARKAGIKTAKWAIWTLLALLLASTFVAYFVSWKGLLAGLASPGEATGALGTVAFLTALMLFDFGWFRDQMCTVACPYGRLQSVMADPDTILVAYDAKRGDPKVKVKDRVAGVAAGDCIDCRSCVNACPTGTDIRRGLQSECIGTAQCIDACDEVMLGQKKPIGLIKYTSEREEAGGTRRLVRPRNLIYLALLTLAWGSLAFLLLTRADALVEIVRGGREPYRLLVTGEVANQQRLRVTNQLDVPQSFSVEVLSPGGARLVLAGGPVDVPPEKVVTVNVVTTVPAEVFRDGQATARYLVTSDRGFRKEVEFLLLGPWGKEAGR